MARASKNIRISFTAITPKKLIGIDPDVVDRIRDYTHDAAEELVKEAQNDYQRVQPSASYQRTYVLHDSWMLTPTRYGGGTGWLLTNNADSEYDGRSYSSFVQGRRQASWHAYRGWRTIDKILEDWGGRQRFRAEAQQIVSDSLRV